MMYLQILIVQNSIQKEIKQVTLKTTCSGWWVGAAMITETDRLLRPC